MSDADPEGANMSDYRPEAADAYAHGYQAGRTRRAYQDPACWGTHSLDIQCGRCTRLLEARLADRLIEGNVTELLTLGLLPPAIDNGRHHTLVKWEVSGGICECPVCGIITIGRQVDFLAVACMPLTPESDGEE